LVALSTKNQSINHISTEGNVNDQFSSFLDRKQTNYLPNAKGKQNFYCAKMKPKGYSKKKMYFSYLGEANKTSQRHW
jgi:hypothetical protein